MFELKFMLILIKEYCMCKRTYGPKARQSQGFPHLVLRKHGRIGGALALVTDVAAGHSEENQQKLFSRDETDHAYVSKIFTKYLMYILSMQKFGIVCLFSKKIDKIAIG